MLMPKKVKFRKQQRGRMSGKAWTGGHLAFGDYGLKAMECGWVTAREIEAAGRDFFEEAAAQWRAHAPDFKSWTRAVGSGTSRKGAALFMPLRAALTGRTHGPELAPLVQLMGTGRVTDRIAAAGALAASS